MAKSVESLLAAILEELKKLRDDLDDDIEDSFACRLFDRLDDIKDKLDKSN